MNQLQILYSVEGVTTHFGIQRRHFGILPGFENIYLLCETLCCYLIALRVFLFVKYELGIGNQ